MLDTLHGRVATLLCATWLVVLTAYYFVSRLQAQEYWPLLIAGWALVFLATFGVRWAVADRSPQGSTERRSMPNWLQTVLVVVSFLVMMGIVRVLTRL